MALKGWPKLSRWIPLWKRPIPPYPLYNEGNPQLRIYLPLFWIRMVRPPQDIPKDVVHFEVHPQMTKLDIKQYLEKIYEVPVLSVTVGNKRGEEKKHPRFGYIMHREPDKKFAYVRLKDATHEFPDLFSGKKTEQDKLAEQYKDMVNTTEKQKKKDWSKLDVPTWFR